MAHLEGVEQARACVNHVGPTQGGGPCPNDQSEPLAEIATVSSKPTGFGRAGLTRGKVRKAFWLDPRLLEEARAALGATTEREAVEMALDLVGFILIAASCCEIGVTLVSRNTDDLSRIARGFSFEFVTPSPFTFVSNRNPGTALR